MAKLLHVYNCSRPSESLFVQGTDRFHRFSKYPNLFQGKENFENNFRILLPGGGTGNSVNNLGEQLNHTNAEVNQSLWDLKQLILNHQIVYLDFSRASMKVAQRRAKTKGLTNIRWFYDKIENIPKLNLGKII